MAKLLIKFHTFYWTALRGGMSAEKKHFLENWGRHAASGIGEVRRI